MNKDSGMYIRREDAVHVIEAWADRNEGKPMRQPSIVARLMATKIEDVKSVQIDPVYHGPLFRDFTGMNIAYGECGNCGARLMWYAKNPIKGCPYCFFRFGKRGGAD